MLSQNITGPSRPVARADSVSMMQLWPHTAVCARRSTMSKPQIKRVERLMNQIESERQHAEKRKPWKPTANSRKVSGADAAARQQAAATPC
jgi:hypothetical protein